MLLVDRQALSEHTTTSSSTKSVGQALRVSLVKPGAYLSESHQRKVPPVLLAFLAAGVGWDECSFDIFVQFIQVQITEDRAHDRALWRTTQRGVIVPAVYLHPADKYHRLTRRLLQG